MTFRGPRGQIHGCGPLGKAPTNEKIAMCPHLPSPW